MIHVEVYELRFVDPDVNARKFYRTYVTETGEWALQWGRIGSTGQLKTGQAPSENAAWGLVNTRRYDKLAKGYELWGRREFYLVDGSTLESCGSYGLGQRLLGATVLGTATYPAPAPKVDPGVMAAKEEAEAEEFRQTLLKMHARNSGEPEPEPAEVTMADRLASALEKAKATTKESH